MANIFNHGAGLETVVLYKECLHNHGVDVRGHVLDGCGQFVASGLEGTQPASVCAACGCHRSFHRQVKEVVQPQPQAPERTEFTDAPPQRQHQAQTGNHNAPQQHGRMVQNFARILFISRIRSSNVLPVQGSSGQQATEPRGRLTREQSEQLRVISETNNWKRFREYSKEEVTLICSEIGIKRRVLSDWISRHRLKRAANQPLIIRD